MSVSIYIDIHTDWQGLQLNRTSTEEEIQRECEKYGNDDILMY